MILVPNCNNPLGFIMPDARKRAVLNLPNATISLFSKMIFTASWPPNTRARARSTLGYRRPGCSAAPLPKPSPLAAYRLDRPRALLRQAATDEVRRQRDQRPSTQLAACNFIREGHYHRHVRRMRQIYQRNIEIYTCWLREFFPAGSASPGRRAVLCCGLSSRSR